MLLAFSGFSSVPLIVVRKVIGASGNPACFQDFLYYNSGMVKPKMGRPPKEPTDRLAEIIQFRMTTEERQECERIAERAGVKFSAWIRDRLLRAAKRESKRD